jgi:hypothetical protein
VRRRGHMIENRIFEIFSQMKYGTWSRNFEIPENSNCGQVKSAHAGKNFSKEKTASQSFLAS